MKNHSPRFWRWPRFRPKNNLQINIAAIPRNLQVTQRVATKPYTPPISTAYINKHALTEPPPVSNAFVFQTSVKLPTQTPNHNLRATSLQRLQRVSLPCVLLPVFPVLSFAQNMCSGRSPSPKSNPLWFTSVFPRFSLLAVESREQYLVLSS